jgi:hypothetical protein
MRALVYMIGFLSFGFLVQYLEEETDLQVCAKERLEKRLLGFGDMEIERKLMIRIES